MAVLADIRIAHHLTLPFVGQGMRSQVADLVRAEVRAGLDSGIVDTDPVFGPAGGGKALDHLTKPWTWADECPEATVHVFQSKLPDRFTGLRHTVGILHGTPEHCAIRQMWPKGPGEEAFLASLTFINACDQAVALIPRHAQYWREYDPGGKLNVVRAGVDLQGKWRPEWLLTPEERGRAIKNEVGAWEPVWKTVLRGKPAILLADSYYEVKNPLASVLSIKPLARRVPGARLAFYAAKGEDSIGRFWEECGIPKAYLEHLIERYEPRSDAIERVYRAAHVYVSMALGGDLSKCAMEAMACGTPALTLASGTSLNRPEWTCENEPESIAEAAARLWDKMAINEQDVRERARIFAEEHFDIDRVVRELIPVYERALAA